MIKRPILGPSLGNPRLGRETRAELERRTRTFRNQNFVMKSDKLYVAGDVCRALGVGRNDTRQPGRFSLQTFLDSYDNSSFWR